MKTTWVKRVALLGVALVLTPALAPAQWRTERLSQARANLAATANGTRVFFAGGMIDIAAGGVNSTPSDVVDIFDVATSTWSQARLSQPRYDLVAASVGNKVLFAGGVAVGGIPSDVVDIYDVATNTWSQARLSVARTDLAAANAGGRAVFGGGADANGRPLGAVDIYSPETDAWTQARLPTPRADLTAVGASGRVYFAGGKSEAAPSAVVDVLDVATTTWTSQTLSQARYGLVATSIGDRLVFAGGLAVGLSDVVDIYDPTTNTWSQDRLSEARIDPAATSNGVQAFVGGGRAAFQASAVVDAYTTGWSTASLSVARTNLAAASTGGRVFFAGGFTATGWPSDAVNVYDPPPPIDSRFRRWTTATLSHPRGGLVGVAADSKVFFAGGKLTPNGSGYSGAVDIYDVATNTWSTNGLSLNRAYLAAAYYQGKVFFGGGESDDGPTDRVDIYDLATGTWSTSKLTAPRSHLGAGVAGEFLVFGGGTQPDGMPSNVLDIYDTSTGKFMAASLSSANGPSIGNKFATVSVPFLDNDNLSTVLFVGGEWTGDNGLQVFYGVGIGVVGVNDGFEVNAYDAKARSRMAATPVQFMFQNYVLVAGGMTPDGETNAVELFSGGIDMAPAFATRTEPDGPRLSVARCDLAAATAAEEDAWILAGGSIQGKATAAVDIFYNREHYTDYLSQARFGLAGVGVPNSGMALFAGGFTGSGENATRQVDIYTVLDPWTGQPVGGDGATPVLAPRIVSHPADQTACAGSTVRARIEATSPGRDLTYQWYKQTSPSSGPRFVPGQTQTELYLATVQPTDAGTYWCHVWNGVKSTWSRAFTLAVAPLTLGQPAVGSAPACAGGPLAVTVAANCAGSGFRVELSNALGSFATPTALGTAQPGANRFDLPAALPTGTGYRVRVVSGNPALTSAASAAFTINGLAGVAVALFPATPSRICLGADLPVTFSTTGSCPFPAGNVFTVQLSSAIGSFANPTVLGTAPPGTTSFALPENLPPGTGYRVRVLSTNPAQTSASSLPFELRAPSLGGVTPGVGGVPVCRGNQVTLSFSLPTGSCPFPGGNLFTAQLSNATGSFISPVSLGNVQAGISNSLTIPATSTAGTGYRIRVVSSSPALTSLSSSPFRVNGCVSRLSAEVAELIVSPNPALGNEIRLRVSGMDSPQFGLTTSAGRSVSVSVKTDGSSEFVLTPRLALVPGVYAVQATEGGTRITRRVLVTD